MQVKYTFKKDGSGKMEMGAEMGQAMKMMQMMGAGGEEENGSSGDPMNDLFKNMDSNMDTIISFKDIMPDSIKGTPEGDQMESWNIRMTADPNSEEMYMGMETDFEKVGDVEEKIKAMRGMNSGGMDMSSSSPIPDDYFSNKMYFSGKTLKIPAYKMPEDDQSIKELMEEEEEADPMMDQMMGNMNVRLVYEVPGKVKKVKYKGPWKLVDDYTVMVEYTMEEFDAIKVFPPMIIKWK